jgi:hypothetical protein
MKRILLAACAVLALSAAADARNKVVMPNVLVGEWCYDLKDPPGWYFRRVNDCKNSVEFKRFFDECIPEGIEQISEKADAQTWVVKARCVGETVRYRSFRFALTGNDLWVVEEKHDES